MFAVALIVLLLLLFLVGFASRRRAESVDEFVLAGHQFGVAMSACSLIATWYGAESLLTLSDEVSRVGLHCIWIDPIGIALCLLLMGLFVAPKLYRQNVKTIGDLFLQAGGRKCEFVCSLIVVPSYFGWIAAQLIALSLLLQTFMGIPIVFGIVGAACVTGALCWLGGNTSVAWVNALLLGVIAIGLSCLAIAVLRGRVLFPNGDWSLANSIPDSHWQLGDPSKRSPWLAIVGALAVGAIGNLPAIELIQRVRSAKDYQTARLACVCASMVYLLLGIVPIFYGLCFAAHTWTSQDQTQVVSALAVHYLSPPLQVLLFLAVVATILSTLTSAAMAPASMMAINLIEPFAKRTANIEWNEHQRVRLQRYCILLMLALGVCLAMSGETAFQLVRDCYGMLLSSIVVPFLAILFHKTPLHPVGILSSMLLGATAWAVHWLTDNDHFGGPLLANYLELPHEIGEAILSGLPFLLWRMQNHSRPSKWTQIHDGATTAF